MPIALPAVLDTDAAVPLRQTLDGMVARRESLLLDGAAVERAGLACLQVLAAARAAAAEAGLAFRIEAAGAALVEMTALARLDLLPDAA